MAGGAISGSPHGGNNTRNIRTFQFLPIFQHVPVASDISPLVTFHVGGTLLRTKGNVYLNRRLERQVLIFVALLPPWGLPEIAPPAMFQAVGAGYWVKFSTGNNRASDRPHWLRYRHCAKLPCKWIHGYMYCDIYHNSMPLI